MPEAQKLGYLLYRQEQIAENGNRKGAVIIKAWKKTLKKRVKNQFVLRASAHDVALNAAGEDTEPVGMDSAAVGVESTPKSKKIPKRHPM